MIQQAHAHAGSLLTLDPTPHTPSMPQGGPRSLQQRGRRIIMSGAFGKTEVAGDLSGSHELCIVFLHGLGDSGKDWTNVWSKNIGACCHAALRLLAVCQAERSAVSDDVEDQGAEEALRYQERIVAPVLQAVSRASGSPFSACLECPTPTVSRASAVSVLHAVHATASTHTQHACAMLCAVWRVANPTRRPSAGTHAARMKATVKCVLVAGDPGASTDWRLAGSTRRLAPLRHKYLTSSRASRGRRLGLRAPATDRGQCCTVVTAYAHIVEWSPQHRLRA